MNAADLKPVTSDNQLVKYADDTYLIIPAKNKDYRQKELDNIESWARANNLNLNRAKSNEIIFVDSRRQKRVQYPPPLADINRVTTLKILGVTVKR